MRELLWLIFIPLESTNVESIKNGKEINQEGEGNDIYKKIKKGKHI